LVGESRRYDVDGWNESGARMLENAVTPVLVLLTIFFVVGAIFALAFEFI